LCNIQHVCISLGEPAFSRLWPSLAALRERAQEQEKRDDPKLQGTATKDAARAMTQEELGRKLGLKQAAISRMERRTDVYVSTLSKFVEGMGGRLEIRVVFPDGAIRINQFGDALGPRKR
jgi:hypothetical protein